jgi:apolipoprotein N-acyltransferase
VSARKLNNSFSYYDHFNSALQIDTGHIINIYKKSRLVPGIEKQFLTGPGKLISRILPYLGGTQWGYGTQKERVCFEHHKTHMKVAPIICYESVFGKYVTDYVKKGANVLFLMTNDGWWKNTNGYKQHLSYASLRAIETRRPVARAANTGISCLIDIKGRITSESKWWKEATIKGHVSNETLITPYVRCGDYLARFGSLIGIIIIIVVFIGFPIVKKLK